MRMTTRAAALPQPPLRSRGVKGLVRETCQKLFMAWSTRLDTPRDVPLVIPPLLLITSRPFYTRPCGWLADPLSASEIPSTSPFPGVDPVRMGLKGCFSTSCTESAAHLTGAGKVCDAP